MLDIKKIEERQEVIKKIIELMAEDLKKDKKTVSACIYPFRDLVSINYDRSDLKGFTCSIEEFRYMQEEAEKSYLAFDYAIKMIAAFGDKLGLGK